MRDEKEINDKIQDLKKEQKRAERYYDYEYSDHVGIQINLLNWVLKSNHKKRSWV